MIKDVAFLKRLLVLLCGLLLLFLPAQGKQPEKLVALTFDDGPSGRFTQALLDGLAERNVRATFLLCGYRMAQYPTLTARIHQAGHEIGLHGYSHKAMDTMCQRDLYQEIDQTMALLPAGCRASFLRPPGGQSNALTRAAAQSRDLSLLLWSVDPRDWATDDATAVTSAVVCQVRDGDVILLHDMSDSSVKAALDIVDQLMAQGFRFVTASELARARNTQLCPGSTYCRFSCAH